MCILDQLAGLSQGVAQRRLELLAEIRQLLAIVGVQHFQPQAAKYRKICQMAEQHADPVQLWQVDKHPACPLPREDQLIEAHPAHQALCTVLLGADKFRAGGTRLGLGITGNVQTRGVLGDFRAHLIFKTRTAVQQQRIHQRLSSRRAS